MSTTKNTPGPGFNGPDTLLIAELLGALINAEKALNHIRVCCRHTAWDATGPAVIAARAAIAKATGSTA